MAEFKVIGEGADAVVVPSTAKNPIREWYDYGKDTGPRLRVKQVYEGAEVDKVIADGANYAPVTTDRGEERAVHEASEKAFRDGDSKALGTIYEDLLDEVHSADFGERKKRDVTLERAWAELEAALTAELRELSRAEKKETWGFRIHEHGLSLRVVPLDTSKETLEVRLDKKALHRRLAHAMADARESAAIIVKNAREEIAQARAMMIVGGPGAVAFEREASSA